MAVRSHPKIDIISPTIEAVVLNCISGMLAQAFAAYQAKDIFAVDIGQILQIMLFTAITAAPNFIFQTALERHFPSRTIEQPRLEVVDSKNETIKEQLLAKYGQLSVPNTIIKFVLDQSLGATTNTMLFIVVLGWIKGQSVAHIQGSLFEVCGSRSSEPLS